MIVYEIKEHDGHQRVHEEEIRMHPVTAEGGEHSLWRGSCIPLISDSLCCLADVARRADHAIHNGLFAAQ